MVTQRAWRSIRLITLALPLLALSASTQLSACTDSTAPNGCCKICKTGKACGDSCIAKSDTCNKGVVCSACSLDSWRIHDFADAYLRLTPVRCGDIVVMDGIGFFDYLHGQTDVAPIGFELHPVVAARVVGSISTSQPDSARQPVPSEARTTSAVRVWVNTSSGVYHCPGSQWYGTTRRGIYMTESAAAAAGYRPAYNRRCS